MGCSLSSSSAVHPLPVVLDVSSYRIHFSTLLPILVRSPDDPRLVLSSYERAGLLPGNRIDLWRSIATDSLPPQNMPREEILALICLVAERAKERASRLASREGCAGENEE